MAAITLPLSFFLARGCLRGRGAIDERGGATRCAMIAGVNGWFAVLSALLVLLPRDARAADDLSGAVRELARKTVAFAGRGEPVSLSWRNRLLARLGRIQPGARGVRKRAARGGRPGKRHCAGGGGALHHFGKPDADSDCGRGAQGRRPPGMDRRLEAKRRRPRPPSAGMSLEKKLLWEQEEQILDARSAGDGVLVLSPSRITAARAAAPRQSSAGHAARPWPRDLRGHLRVSGGGFKAVLPGRGVQRVDWSPRSPWSATRATSPGRWMRARAACCWPISRAARNYFDGRVVPRERRTQDSRRRSFPPRRLTRAGRLTGCSPCPGDGRRFWMADSTRRAAWPDGAATWRRPRRAAAAGRRCWRRGRATRARPDALRAFALANRDARAADPPLDLPGPVTALWSAGGNAAIAVVRDLATGRYAAYGITVNCGE